MCLSQYNPASSEAYSDYCRENPTCDSPGKSGANSDGPNAIVLVSLALDSQQLFDLLTSGASLCSSILEFRF